MGEQVPSSNLPKTVAKRMPFKYPPYYLNSIKVYYQTTIDADLIPITFALRNWGSSISNPLLQFSYNRFAFLSCKYHVSPINRNVAVKPLRRKELYCMGMQKKTDRYLGGLSTYLGGDGEIRTRRGSFCPILSRPKVR